MGLLPDGEAHAAEGSQPRSRGNIVDAAWTRIDWTLGRALRTSRFW